MLQASSNNMTKYGNKKKGTEKLTVFMAKMACRLVWVLILDAGLAQLVNAPTQAHVQSCL